MSRQTREHGQASSWYNRSWAPPAKQHTKNSYSGWSKWGTRGYHSDYYDRSRQWEDSKPSGLTKDNEGATEVSSEVEVEVVHAGAHFLVFCNGAGNGEGSTTIEAGEPQRWLMSSTEPRKTRTVCRTKWIALARIWALLPKNSRTAGPHTKQQMQNCAAPSGKSVKGGHLMRRFVEARRAWQKTYDLKMQGLRDTRKLDVPQGKNQTHRQ